MSVSSLTIRKEHPSTSTGPERGARCQILINDYFDWDVGAENARAELWTLPLSYFAELCSH